MGQDIKCGANNKKSDIFDKKIKRRNLKGGPFKSGAQDAGGRNGW